MKKKQQLTLNRESLRNLTFGEMNRAAGGACNDSVRNDGGSGGCPPPGCYNNSVCYIGGYTWKGRKSYAETGILYAC